MCYHTFQWLEHKCVDMLTIQLNSHPLHGLHLECICIIHVSLRRIDPLTNFVRIYAHMVDVNIQRLGGHCLRAAGPRSLPHQFCGELRLL